LLEGLATYVESIARAQREYLSEDFIWRNFIERMPLGLPQDGDRGLDRTPTWGRTYWGGAIFCLLADVEIRRLSNNRKSLRDALRGVLDAGLSMHAARTTPADIFAIGDRTVGVDALAPLYAKMKDRPYPVSLDWIWQSLGVSLYDGRVIYNDAAPKVDIRNSLLKSADDLGTS
jgi:predicted metalloprotease with PDZ domain